MAGTQFTYMERAKKYLDWKAAVSNMNGFLIPASFQPSRPGNKYYRFTEYVQYYILHLTNSVDGENAPAPDNIQLGFRKATGNTAQLSENWWAEAMAAGKGSTQENSLPKIEDPTKEQKEAVYEELMPLYRALKDSFSKRSFLQFIFNHRQYTAERDALAAVTGMIRSLTGDTVEQIESRRAEHRAEITAKNFGEMITENQNLEKRALEEVENKKISEQINLYKKEGEEERAIIEEVRKEQAQYVSELKGKEQQTLSESERYTLLIDNADVKVAQLDALTDECMQYVVLPEDKSLAVARGTLAKLIIKGVGLGNVMPLAKKLCSDYDDAIKEGGNPQELIEKTAKAMFKEAFKNIAAAKLQSVEDRIYLAQMMTDVVLQRTTPVGRYDNEYGKYGRGYVLNNDADFVREVLRANKIDEGVIDESIDKAKGLVNKHYPQRDKISVSELGSKPDVQLSSPVQGSNSVPTNVKNV